MFNWTRSTIFILTTLLSGNLYAQNACLPPAHGFPLIPQGSANSLLSLQFIEDPDGGVVCDRAYASAANQTPASAQNRPVPRNHTYQYVVTEELSNRQRLLFITPTPRALATTSALSMEVYRQTFSANPATLDAPTELRVLLTRDGADDTGKRLIQMKVVVYRGIEKSTSLTIPLHPGETCSGPLNNFAACLSINSFPDRIELAALSGPAFSSTVLAPAKVTEILIGNVSAQSGTLNDIFQFAHAVYENN